MQAELRKQAEDRQKQDQLWMEQQKEADRKAREEDKQADRNYQESQRKLQHEREDRIKLADRKWAIVQIVVGAVFSLVTGAIGLWIGKATSSPQAAVPPIIIQLPDGKEIKVK